MRDLKPIVMENVKLVYLNFEGKEDQYNRPGDRNFCVLLPPDVAQAMAADGWNVKTGKLREEGDEPRHTLEVAVSYKIKPPKIWLITSRGRTPIGEDLVTTLDWVEIQNADVIITPSAWDINGKTGIKAYLGTLFLTVREDPLELKYSDVPVSSD